jgi:hypothetical protein
MKSGFSLEVRMLMLGASLVGVNAKSAEIVADALAELDRLRAEVRRLRSAAKAKRKENK